MRNKASTSKTVSETRKTVPFDSDESDPDFVNGTSVVEELKTKKGRRIPAHLLPRRRTTLRLPGSTSVIDDNPLRHWLGSDLDVNSHSDIEGDMDSDVSRYEDDSGLESSTSGSPKQRKAKHPARNVHRRHSPQLGSITGRDLTIESRSLDATRAGLPADDESETESDNEDVHISRKRGTSNHPESPPAKKAKITTADAGNDSITESDSITEPESDKGSPPPSLRMKFPLPVRQSCHPRPAFNTFTSKRPEPLVLDESRGIQVTSSINCWLRDYQREGVEFFYAHYKDDRGCILGDDMGLGKTIQVIAFLSAIMKKIGDDRDENRRQEHVDALQDSEEWRTTRKLPPANTTWPTCLIIAPATVVHNWEREIEKWGYFEVGMYIAPPDERALVLRDFQLGRQDILITSFELALRDIELLETQHWSCIMVDEAHRIKNPKSQTTVAFNRFKHGVRFGLTGTAIQNNYTELWTILDWSNPGQLGTLSQWNEWVTSSLTRGQDSKATDEEIATGRIVAERLVTRLLPNFFLRRTKTIIEDQLPKKIDQVVFCPLTDSQKKVYKRFLNTPEVQTMLKKDDSCDCGSGKLGRNCHYNIWDKSWVFQYIVILIKISNHLALILPAPIDTPEQTLRHRDQANTGWPPVDGRPTAPSYGEAVFDPQMCGKWKVLKVLLTTWRDEEDDNKVLIFTKSVKIIEMLEQRLKESFMDFRKLDGSVKKQDRMRLVDEFNEDPRVFIFLISTLAGGVGLNLTGANKVVIFDPNWNPAHDLQAMDRAYRFGQLRDVFVYRLLGAGSIEELIYKRQVYKQQQMKIGYEASHQTRYFEGVQGDKTKRGDLFGLKNIFSLDEAGTKTKHAIEKSRLAQFDWALTHLDGKSRPKGVAEEGIAIDEFSDRSDESNLKGLGALFFGTDNEDVPRNQEREDEVLKILNSNGVSYVHHNESLLRSSNIEARLTSKIIQDRKKRSRLRKKADASKPEISWPPKRRHHKLQLPRKARLEERMDALLALGYIRDTADLSRFAEDFLHKPEGYQERILGELDEETAKLAKKDSSR